MAEKTAQELADGIRKRVSDFWSTAEGKALRIRLDLAKHVMQVLDEKGWTQRRLAKEVGCKDSFLSNVIHGDQNWTTETYGRIAHALGIDFELCKATPDFKYHAGQSVLNMTLGDSGDDYGLYEISQNEAPTGNFQTTEAVHG